jgi:predicted metal-dependent enzyme (double-stranded beta helix superfamily)
VRTSCSPLRIRPTTDRGGHPRFDLDTFIADCVAGADHAQPRLALKELLTRAMAEPSGVARALPADRAGIERLHVSPTLTVLKVVWGPGMRIFPHDHRMWAAIGIYTGQEDNTFYRRAPEGVIASGGAQLGERDVALLGDDTIHAVVNPRREHTGAIHVYGGDFFTQPRSEFDPETLEEGPYRVGRTLALFQTANQRGG